MAKSQLTMLITRASEAVEYWRAKLVSAKILGANIILTPNIGGQPPIGPLVPMPMSNILHV